MKEKTLTIQSVASEMYENMTTAKREDGTEYYHLKESIQWQADIIREAHLDRMPDDDVYERIDDILSRLADLEEEATEDEAREAIFEIEPDGYTSDLTEWLSKDNRNVYYLEDAISMGATDGFSLLQDAQCEYIREIGNDLVNGIVKYIENNQ